MNEEKNAMMSATHCASLFRGIMNCELKGCHESGELMLVVQTHELLWASECYSLERKIVPWATIPLQVAAQEQQKIFDNFYKCKRMLSKQLFSS